MFYCTPKSKLKFPPLYSYNNYNFYHRLFNKNIKLKCEIEIFFLWIVKRSMTTMDGPWSLLNKVFVVGCGALFESSHQQLFKIEKIIQYIIIYFRFSLQSILLFFFLMLIFYSSILHSIILIDISIQIDMLKKSKPPTEFIKKINYHMMFKFTFFMTIFLIN